MRKWVIGFLAILAAVFLFNASWFAAAPIDPKIKIISHRGVHQNFDRADLKNDTCTASHIAPPTHEFLENTLASMQAAFAAGADIVELDVHPTTDGFFAVFHDWTLDCRTNGEGETRSHNLAYLKTLDIGHGYTADNGTTFPLRGKGVGKMPALDDVFRTFLNGQFLINFKSQEAREGTMLAELVGDHPEWRAPIWAVYGGNGPTETAVQDITDLRGITTRGVKECLLQYIALGWTGIVPEPCQNTLVMVPGNYAGFLWGWPNRFQQRMHDAGSEIILLGPYIQNDPGTRGIDSPDEIALIPSGFDGYVWTNRIETMGTEIDKLNAVQ